MSKDDEIITHYLEYLIRYSLPEQSRLLILHSVFGSVEFMDWKILTDKSGLISFIDSWSLG